MTDLVTDLRTLAELPGPPGHEQQVAAHLRRRWSAAGEVRTDGLGNLTVSLGEARGAPLALCAHMDEVALIVRAIDDDGFLRLHRVGGVPERVLTQRELVVLTRGGPVTGVVGTHAHHLTPDDAKYRVPTVDRIYLDVGARSAREAEQELGIRVGDMAVYARTFREQAGRVVTNALDDRAGLAAVSQVIDRLVADPPDSGVTCIASVQEEFNVRGAVPAVRAAAPAVLVTVDISPATDTPELAGSGSDIRLGAGPVMHRYSFHGRGTLGGVIPPPWVVDTVEQVALERSIPLQRASFFGGLTDGSFAQLEGDGIPTIEIGVPVRYTHAPYETCSLDDLAGLVDLLEGLARAPWSRPHEER